MARIRTLVILVLAAGVVAVALAWPTLATGQCEPTCTQECKAQFKACTASVKQGQTMQRAQCTMSAKVSGALCTFMSTVGKVSACLGKCGMALDECRSAIKQDVADCKAGSKSDAKACRAMADDIGVQGRLGCAQDHASCLDKCMSS